MAAARVCPVLAPRVGSDWLSPASRSVFALQVRARLSTPAKVAAARFPGSVNNPPKRGAARPVARVCAGSRDSSAEGASALLAH